MRIYYYKSPVGNFGDDLNEWLWPQLFPRIKSVQHDTGFVGIGTILGAGIAAEMRRRIVFGSGIRRLSSIPNIDESWDVRFVRGPITAAALGIDPSLGIADGAACLGLLEWKKVVPKFEVGFVPHLHVMQALPNALRLPQGMVLISPCLSVPEAISLIRQCRCVITESLHGAIVADLFRVPWSRVNLVSWLTETPSVSSMKWLDWGLPLRLDTTPTCNALLPYLCHRLLRPMRAIARITMGRVLRIHLKAALRGGGFRLSDPGLLDQQMWRLKRVVQGVAMDYGIG